MAQNRQTTPLLEHKSKVTVVKKEKKASKYRDIKRGMCIEKRNKEEAYVL